MGHSSAVENYQIAYACMLLPAASAGVTLIWAVQCPSQTQLTKSPLSSISIVFPFRYEFLRTNATELVDGGREQVMRQQGFQLINPTEKWFPGITELRNNFESWAWRFGKTPAFSVERKLPVQSQQQQSSQEEGTMPEGDSLSTGGKRHELKLKVDVVEGLISEISLVLGENGESISVVSQLKGSEYTEDNLNAIYDSLKSIKPDALMAQAINGS